MKSLHVHTQGEFAMGLIAEFKQFIQRGNVVDLAVGVIMGAAFGKIVNSLVTNVLMPPIGYLINGVKFTDLKYDLPEKIISVPDPSNPGSMTKLVLDPASIKYGEFLQATFDFIIISSCIFLLVKGINRLKKKEETAPPPPPVTPEQKLLAEIRDLLKAQQGPVG